MLLPDGKVLIGQGVNRSVDLYRRRTAVHFDEKEGHLFQMFDPATGSVTKLAKTTVSRGLHGTATLLPDATVFFAGENREALVRPDDPSFPLASSYAGIAPARRSRPGRAGRPGLLAAVSLSEGRRPASRPAIVQRRGRSATAGTSTSGSPAARMKSDRWSLLRSDHNTHSLTTGDRYVKLAFHAEGCRLATFG